MQQMDSCFGFDIGANAKDSVAIAQIEIPFSLSRQSIQVRFEGFDALYIRHGGLKYQDFHIELILNE
jgi:hypothetical protein